MTLIEKPRAFGAFLLFAGLAALLVLRLVADFAHAAIWIAWAILNVGNSIIFVVDWRAAGKDLAAQRALL